VQANFKPTKIALKLTEWNFVNGLFFAPMKSCKQSQTSLKYKLLVILPEDRFNLSKLLIFYPLPVAAS